jgi:hypothetical protein
VSLDPRIPLGAISQNRSAFDFDLLGMARQATALHTEQAQMREQARKAQAQQAFQQAVQEADGDYDLALDLLDKRGHGDTALGLRGELQKYRTEAFKTLEQQSGARQKELALFSSLANLITDDESQALVLNSLSPELRATASRVLGDRFDPQRAQTARDTLLSESDRINRQKHAFELMKDARDFAAGTPERKAKEALALGQYLSATQTPEEYAQTLQRAPELGISREVARLFQGKTAQQAGELAMAPDKRADNARMQAQLAEQQRHNRVAEGISAGQLNVARGNLNQRIKEGQGGGDGSGPATASDTELVEAILANPAIYADLTPTIKARLAGTLAKRGFKQFASTPGQKAGGPNVGAILSEIETLSTKINTGEGNPMTNVAGMIRRGRAAGNMDNDVAQYQALISGMIPMVARAVGHTGVLTQQDVDSVRAMFPRVGDNKALAAKKMATIKSLIGSVGAAPPPPPGDKAADPLGIRR